MFSLEDRSVASQLSHIMKRYGSDTAENNVVTHGSDFDYKRSLTSTRRSLIIRSGSERVSPVHVTTDTLEDGHETQDNTK